MLVRKVSLTLPSDLLDEAQRYAPGGHLSAHMANGLRRRVHSDRLGRYLRELDAECGPLTDEENATARAMASETAWLYGRRLPDVF